MNLLTKNRIPNLTGSVTDNPDYRHLAAAAEDRRQWNLEAGDVRRYVESLTQFDPYAGEPVIRLTAAEQDEARRILAAETLTPQRPQTECPNSSNKRHRSRAIGTFCRRAYRREIIDAGTGRPAFVFLACDSRTCRDCRPGIDNADAERIADGLGTVAYLAEIDADKWGTVSKRLRRHSVDAVKIPSTRDPLKIVVVANEPPTPDAVRIVDVATVVRDLMMTRPTGQTRRMTTLGGIESRNEWEDRQKAEAVDSGRAFSPTVQPADVEKVADALGVPVTVTTTAYATTIRVGETDAWRLDALRRWCRNPGGKQWADMRRETLIREGALDPDPPPLDLFTPPPEEAVA
jgi:hypothetical protein